MRKKEGRPFAKKARSKLRRKPSAALRKAGGKANISRHKPKPVITRFCNLPHNNTATIPVNVKEKLLHKPNAVIKLPAGGAPPRSRRGQGDGVSPLGSKLCASSGRAAPMAQNLRKSQKISQNLPKFSALTMKYTHSRVSGRGKIL